MSTSEEPKPGMENTRSTIIEEDDIQLRTLQKANETHQGNHPAPGSTVRIQYEVSIFNGKLNKKDPPFDSSFRRNLPLCFQLGTGQVIRGVEMAVCKMCLGEVAEAIIPYKYGYGAAGYPPIIPENAALVFKLELLDFTE